MQRMHRGAGLWFGFGLWLVLMFGAVAGQAQGYSADKPLGSTAQQLPSYLAHAGLEQRLGQPLPLTTLYTDETGHTAPLSTWVGGRPAAVALVYYRCLMLCPQVLHGLATGLHQVSLKPGQDYDVLVFSIDPADTPKDALVQKAMFLQELGGGAAAAPAVHFLTGTQPAIDAVAGATGFHYVKVPGPDGKMDQFAHSSVVMFTTPNGRLSKYLAGINYQPRDLRMALLEASAHHISNPVDMVILYCCSYNPAVGRYSVSVMRILGIAAMFTLLIVAGVLFLLSRKPKAHAAS